MFLLLAVVIRSSMRIRRKTMTPNPLAVYAANMCVDPENYERIAWLLLGEKARLLERIEELEGIARRDHTTIELLKEKLNARGT
jgi:hypothetical protein